MTSWAKTILMVYRLLEKVADGIDKIVIKRAENAGIYYGDLYGFNNIYKISESILNLTERKICLINLKLICEKALENSDKELSRILISNYIDNNKAHETASILNLSMRSYFRKHNKALLNFSNALKRLGYNEEYFENMLKDEVWIKNIKQSVDKKQDTFVIDNKYIKLIYNDYERTNYNRQTHNSRIF